jgi:hypothetical protein
MPTMPQGDGWSDSDNDADDWYLNAESAGAPGYSLPVGWPSYPKPATHIIGGCSRCKGGVLFRPRDAARWCPHCDRAFFADYSKMIFRIPIYLGPSADCP